MKPLEPRGPIEICNITDRLPGDRIILGYAFHSDRSTWLHSRQSAPELMDSNIHELFHHNFPEYGEREVESWTENEMVNLAVDGLIHYIEILEQAKGWWRIRRKMGNYALKCWGIEI